MYEGRLRNSGLLSRVTSAEDAALLIKDGMILGASGFTPSGYPKAVPLALAKRVRETGEKMKIGLFTGASVGDELDGELVRNGIIGRRLPYQTNDSLRNSINQRDCEFIDMHLSHTPQYIRYGYLGGIDIAIIEAVAITEEGHIVPSTSIGNSPCFVEKAEKVIVEINTSQPLELDGMADIYIPENPPFRKPIPILTPNDRIGTTYIPCGVDKIAAVVITDIPDGVKPLAPVDDIAKRISSNLIEFLIFEVKKGRLPKNLLPLQSGVGSVANAVLAGLLDSSFENLSCYSEVVQDSMLDLLDCGKARCASTTSITLSAHRMAEFKRNVRSYKDKLILRPQEISNNPEVIRRLGIISINTAIEADIYGNVNSTHIMGQKMMNGIGGSGDFARNAFLSIFTTESTAKRGAISSIVPMVSHCDHSEHDVMVIITENGVADLRGTSPKERARRIIENCAHDDYKPLLREYLERAEKTRPGHTAHILKEAYDMHIRYMDTGTMSK
jgi:succinyl-CoA:acetate CoA-transferase